jgi:hypothetical protein
MGLRRNLWVASPIIAVETLIDRWNCGAARKTRAREVDASEELSGGPSALSGARQREEITTTWMNQRVPFLTPHQLKKPPYEKTLLHRPSNTSERSIWQPNRMPP